MKRLEVEFMAILRLLLPLAIVVGLVIFVVSNGTPVVPLVLLGTPTPPLPLAAWVLGAIAAGSGTTLAITVLAQVPAAKSRPYRNRGYGDRPPYRPAHAQGFGDDDEDEDDWQIEELDDNPQPRDSPPGSRIRDSKTPDLRTPDPRPPDFRTPDLNSAERDSAERDSAERVGIDSQSDAPVSDQTVSDRTASDRSNRVSNWRGSSYESEQNRDSEDELDWLDDDDRGGGDRPFDREGESRNQIDSNRQRFDREEFHQERFNSSETVLQDEGDANEGAPDDFMEQAPRRSPLDDWDTFSTPRQSWEDWQVEDKSDRKRGSSRRISWGLNRNRGKQNASRATSERTASERGDRTNFSSDPNQNPDRRDPPRPEQRRGGGDADLQDWGRGIPSDWQDYENRGGYDPDADGDDYPYRPERGAGDGDDDRYSPEPYGAEADAEFYDDEATRRLWRDEADAEDADVETGYEDGYSDESYDQDDGAYARPYADDYRKQPYHSSAAYEPEYEPEYEPGGYDPGEYEPEAYEPEDCSPQGVADGRAAPPYDEAYEDAPYEPPYEEVYDEGDRPIEAADRPEGSYIDYVRYNEEDDFYDDFEDYNSPASQRSRRRRAASRGDRDSDGASEAPQPDDETSNYGINNDDANDTDDSLLDLEDLENWDDFTPVVTDVGTDVGTGSASRPDDASQTQESAAPRRIVEIPYKPQTINHQGSIYSYSYRNPDGSGVGQSESVFQNKEESDSEATQQEAPQMPDAGTDAPDALEQDGDRP